jgi:hypothetical protein
MNGTCKISGTPWIIGIEEGEVMQIKGIDNLFNRIIAENFPNLEKESPRYMKLIEHQTTSTKRVTPSDTS